MTIASLNYWKPVMTSACNEKDMNGSLYRHEVTYSPTLFVQYSLNMLRVHSTAQRPRGEISACKLRLDTRQGTEKNFSLIKKVPTLKLFAQRW
jgi:hypothetical protein